jgi:iron complex transport system ATP-binding protein
METVQLHQLSIGYASKVVADNLDGAISSGELTCLLGQNGIGKSTMLRTLAGFQPKLSGTVSICGRDISEYTDKELSRTIGIVLTEKPDVKNMTIEEMVGMGRSPYTGFWGNLSAADRQVVSDAITMVGINSLCGRLIHTLSDGERQKVMMAKALAQQTPIIYLDEPTAFLDFPSKVEMMQLLHRLAAEEQKTIFLSTHDVELSLQIADRIWLMEPGRLSVGSPQQLAADGTLSRFIERKGITFDTQSLTIHITK